MTSEEGQRRGTAYDGPGMRLDGLERIDVDEEPAEYAVRVVIVRKELGDSSVHGGAGQREIVQVNPSEPLQNLQHDIVRSTQDRHPYRAQPRCIDTHKPEIPSRATVSAAVSIVEREGKDRVGRISAVKVCAWGTDFAGDQHEATHPINTNGRRAQTSG